MPKIALLFLVSAAFWTSGCATAHSDCGTPAPSRETTEGTDATDSQFWNEVAVCAEWSEYFPTILDLAANADLVVFGTIASVERYKEIFGDAEEDVVTEVEIKVDIDATIHGQASDTVGFSMVLSKATTSDSATEAINTMSRSIPRGQVLLLLRKRDDSNQFRLVNGYGLWARTSRSDIDVPAIASGSCFEQVYTSELLENEIHSVADLVGYIDCGVG